MADTVKKNSKILEETKKSRKRIAIFAVCFVLALCICMVSVLIVAFSLVTEGTYEEEPVILSSKNADDILTYISALVNGASDNKLVKFNSSVSIGIADLEITPEENSDKEKELVEYVKGDILSFADGAYPADFNGEFGTDYEDRPVIKFDTSALEKATCINGIIDSETGEYKYNEDGTRVDSDYYNIELSLNKDSAEVKELFKLNDDKTAAEKLIKEFADVFSVEGDEIALESLILKARVNRLTDEINHVELLSSYNVKANLKFLLGEIKNAAQTFEFRYDVTRKFNFVYAGISFSEKKVTVAPGSSDKKLSVNALINDDSEYDVKFISADENVVSIDSLGYITGVSESNEPVKVQVVLEYLGNTFTDECEVYVRTPVEKIKISDDELSMKLGENRTLSAELKPANATDGKILWFVEGDAVTVDENGNVTAQKAGEATVIAVSDDGRFRDSCIITVAGGDAE